LATWREYNNTVRDQITQLGIGKQYSKQEIGYALKRGIKAEELIRRAQLFEPWRKSDTTRAWFNGILAQLGRPQLDDEGWRKFMVRGAQSDLYDLYETARLEESGVDAVQGLQIAKALGVGGEPADLTALPSTLQTLKMEAGQELKAAGLTDQDLVTVALREQLSGELRSAADKAAEKVNQILANRQARRETRQQGQQPLSPSGRPVLPSAPGSELQSIG
jgi:hypothetical protein